LAAHGAEGPRLLRQPEETNLYNQRPTWLPEARRKLDGAVFADNG